VASLEQRLRYLYGTTPEEVDQIFNRQEDSCAICRTSEPSGHGWHVDHDHASGVIRGVLCMQCNLLLGNARDSVSILLHAAAYLEERS
jgi:hypothetical protein